MNWHLLLIPKINLLIIISRYFAEILNSPKLTSSNELFIDRDGSWHQNAEVKEEDNSNDADIVILDDTGEFGSPTN